MASAPDDVIQMKPSDWSGAAGERWANNLDNYETMLSEAGEALLDHAALTPGLKVAEIGCGGGAVSRAIARRIAPDGMMVGVDISPVLVPLCEERAAAAGIANARFVTADAGSVRLEDAPFDRLLSRFGIMFFRDPPAAFANLRSLLKSGGRADFAVWAPPAENPAVSALPKAAGRHLNLPPVDPLAPGPFSLSDRDHFHGLLAGAGFSGITFDKWHGDVHLGGKVGAREAALFAMNSSMLADVVAEQPQATQDAIIADLQAMFEPFDGPEGVAIPSAVWLVTAIAP